MILSTTSHKQFKTLVSNFSFFTAFIFLVTLSLNSKAGVNAVPGMPGQVTGQTNVCPYVGTGQEVAYSVEAVAGAEVYLWTVPSTVHIVSGQGTTSISVIFLTGFTTAANKQLRVRAISQDGNSADRIFSLSSQYPSTPASVNGPSNACIYIGTSTQATYTTSRIPSASGYIWGASPATTSIVHPNGSGVNDTVILVTFHAGYKTGPVTVQAINNCGASAARMLNVSGVAPSMPGPINGPNNACAYMLPNGTNATYSINPVAGASSYTWITPAGCIIEHPNGPGATDITVTVQYPSDFVSGSIKVIANSGCDESAPRSLTITRLNPGMPGSITAVQTIVCPNREYSYSLSAMPYNTTAINWTFPPDALSFSGQGTTTLVVKYPEEPVNSIVTATAVSNCGSSNKRQVLVKLGRCQLERSASGSRTAATNLKTDSQEKIISGTMEVNIAPNPSRENFKLKVISPNKETINVKLLDLQGRELKKLNLSAGQLFIFGSELKPGTYILEVNQGKTRHTEKLMKL